MEEDRSEGESEIDSDFEFDDEIKQSLNSLLNIPLEFESSSDEKEDEDDKVMEVGAASKAEERERTGRDDSVERNLKALFAFGSNKQEDVEGLENISDNELDGPESGECDSSDGELPDSPTLVRRVPDQALPVDDNGLEIVDEYPHLQDKECQQVPKREVVSTVDLEKPKIAKKKKDKSQSKTKEKSLLKKIKEKKEKIKTNKEGEYDLKNELKVKKYLARIEQYRLKCIEYVGKMSIKCDNLKKTDSNVINLEKKKHVPLFDKKAKVRSVVEKVSYEREPSSPHSSTSSKIDQLSHSSRSSKAENVSISSKDTKERRSSLNKERKSKSKKSSKTRPEEQVLHYANYIKYLQSEREKCFEESSKKHKHKSKKKHKKRDSCLEKVAKDKLVIPNRENKVLSYEEFCKSRELLSPNKEKQQTQPGPDASKLVEDNNGKTDMIISVDSSSTKPTEPTDEDKELFVTYSDLVELDKQKKTELDEKENNKIEAILEKDPEMKSISVFTSVLFKSDSSGIPFLQEGRLPSPTMEPLKPKPKLVNSHMSGPDEIYDCDDLSSISQSSLSPSRSPAPKIHNQALLNFLEFSKDFKQKKIVSSRKSQDSKSSRSRSKSPKREGSKSKKRKAKRRSSVSLSPSPPPPKPKSPDLYKLKSQSPNHLKKRWKDYPSPPERRKEYASPPDRRKDYSSPPDRRKEYYERMDRNSRGSRSRVRESSGHVLRSRSSSEERYSHSRRHHCQSRSRSRSRTPPSVVVYSEKRRKLKEEHEKALASLRESVRKPMLTQSLSIPFACKGDNYKPFLDNYEPVGMNEDSSQSEKETSPPPLPSGLPPQLPPAPPSAPGAAPNEDLTVVTTYTSFLPITPPHHPPPPAPMSYIPPDIHPFNNWMGSNMPVRDMAPNMYNPSRYYNAPTQQQFPYLNQPPSHLPYQMQRYHHPPPHCLQRFHQVPPSNMNFINVRQDVKNMKPNSIVITQTADSDTDVEIVPTNDMPKPISNNKCKHNPLGQNNQTVQEAIDSVKKCLKNCDRVNKDPRLAAVQERSKSPEKNERDKSLIDKKSHPDETKVKITMSFKPRPVSSVNQVSCFEPEVEIEANEKDLAVNELKTKTNNYTDRSGKIEGIVSKLKDTIGNSSKSDESCKSQPSNEAEDLNKKTATDDEVYDPFTVSEEDNQEPAEEEASTPKKLLAFNDKSVTSTAIRELSPASVERINHEIDEAFAFIFSQTLERKRLTPTLDAIKAQKAEEQKKLHLGQSQLKQFPLLAQVNEDDNTEKSFDTCSNEIDIQMTVIKSPTHINNVEEQQPLLTHNSNELNTSPGVHNQELNSNVLSEKNKLNLNVDENLTDFSTMASETINSSPSSSDASIVKKAPYSESDPLEENVTLIQEKISINHEYNSSTSPDKTMEMCTITVSSKHNTEHSNGRTIENKKKVKSEIFKKRNSSLESNTNKSCNTQERKEHLSNLKQSSDIRKNQYIQSVEDLGKTKGDGKTDEEKNVATIQTVNVNEERLVNSAIKNDNFQSSHKKAGDKERRGIPCLSIPTKGELKRFPSPEINPHKEIKLSPDTKVSNTTANKKRDSSKNDNSKKEMEEQISKPCHSKTAVESIINDFEDNSSAGSDFQEVKNGKDMVVAKKKGNLNSLKKLKEKKLVVHNYNKVALSTDLETSNTNENEVLRGSKEDFISENVSLDKCSDYTKKQRQSVNTKTNNETTCEEKKDLKRTKGKKEKLENYVDSNLDKKNKSNKRTNECQKTGCPVTNTLSRSHELQDSKNQKVPTTLSDETSENEHRQVNEDQDLPLLLTKTPVSLVPACKGQPKPGPLSKKSKSYISKNLPFSFDLSVDSHLIQKGFRKLKVQVAKLESSMPSPQIESSSSSEDMRIENAVQCNVSSVSTNVKSFKKIDSCVKEEGSIKNKEIKKDRSKKKVSFNMNPSKVSIKSEQFQIKDENSQNSAFKSKAQCKASDCCQDPIDVIAKPDLEGVLPTNSNIEPAADKDVDLEEAHTTTISNLMKPKLRQDKSDIFNIALYNKGIINLLNSFRAKPLTHMQSRKSLFITIPDEADVPKAKLRDLQKKVSSSKSSKKSNNRKELNYLSKNESKNLLDNQITSPSVRTKSGTLQSPAQLSDATVCEIKRNNNTQSSEQNESDIEDSFILDRELSDLAKGCLDSDSTVGGDDDSVLNFGIAASDDSSVDNDFCSQVLPTNQTKLSSPLNIKKRFTRRLKSLGIDVNLQKIKSATVLDKQEVQNEANDENMLKAPEAICIKRKSKRGRKPKQDSSIEQAELMIDNTSKTTESLKGNGEVSVVPKEVLKTSKVSGFESLEVESSELRTVTEDSSCKLSEKDAPRDDILHIKDSLIVNPIKEKITMTNKTDPLLSKALKENVADTRSIKGSTDSLQTKISDIDEESKDSMSPLRRVRKMKTNEIDAVLVIDHNSEKCKESPVINCENNVPDISLTQENLNLKNNEEPNALGCIKSLRTNKIVQEIKVEETNYSINVTDNMRTSKGKNIEEEVFVFSNKRARETSNNLSDDSTKHNQVEKVEDDIICQREVDIKDITKTSQDSSLTQSSKLRVRKRKFPEHSSFSDNGLNEVTDVPDIAIKRKEKMLRKKSHVIDSGDILDFNSSTVKGTNSLRELRGIESSKVKKAKANIKDSVQKSENLRQTRSKSQSRKVETAENYDTSINHLNTVTTVKKFLKPTTGHEVYGESTHENNTLLKEVVKLDTNKTEDDNILCKKIQPTLRTVSTESFDEPLISLKNKLLAVANEEKFCEDTTDSNFVEESKTVVKQNSTFQSEENIRELKVCTTCSSNSTGQSSSVNGCSQIDKIPENNEETLSNMENVTNINKNIKSHPDSNRIPGSEKIEGNVHPNEMSTNENLLPNSQEIEHTVTAKISNNIATNPKEKETVKKKKNKAEVDAEIKKRLAEIDELEKLATTQHATVLEKIGARTRSKTVVKLTKPTDDASISNEDYHNTAVNTNYTNTIDSEKSEVHKFVTMTDEATKSPILSKEFQVENSIMSYIKEESKTEQLPTNNNFLENLDTDCILKKANVNSTSTEETSNYQDKTSNKSSEVKPHENDFMSLKNKDKAFENPIKELNCSTSATTSKKGKQCGKIKLCENIAEKSRTFSNDNSPPPKEEMRITRRNTATVNKYRDGNKEPESCVNTKVPCANKSIEKHIFDVEIESKKIPLLDVLENSSFPPLSVRKTRNKTSMYGALSEKSVESSRDSSPSNQMSTKTLEDSLTGIISESKMNKKLVSSTITEPDSSTPTVESSSCSVSTSMDKYKLQTVQRKNKNRAEDLNAVESTLSDISQDPDTVESSAMNTYSQPLRKSVINRKIRNRKAFDGNSLKSMRHSTPVSETNSLDGCDEQDNTLSEGIVSSSVQTVQPKCGLKKKRRKRKSLVDLLMDDSMLSVTRDFPMSPNPYVLPSFYKELEISSNNTQFTNHYDQNINEPADQNTLPPKPDILAQKLRLLEKLKNINRKNRKTRQCRTLVCYNEDSLPESLVESPASEDVPQNSDTAMSAQDLTLFTEHNEFKQSGLMDISDSNKEDLTTMNYCKNQVKTHAKSVVLRKRGRQSASSNNQLQKATDGGLVENSDVKKFKNVNRLKRDFEDNSNSNGSYNYDNDENCSKSLLNMVEMDNSTIDSIQFSRKQENNPKIEKPSEFDQLLLITSNKVERKSNLNLLLDSSLIEESKSYRSSKYFFETLPSHNVINKYNDHAIEDDFNHSKKLPELFKSIQQSSIKEDICSKSDARFVNEKIVCSIPKAKIGKMLPIFGDSSSSEDFDENIPLSVKLLQTNNDSLSLSEKTKNTTTIKSTNVTIKEECLVKKKRGRQQKILVPKPSLRKHKNKLKINSFEVFSDVKNKSSTKESEEVSTMFDSCDEPTLINSESSRSLRKSNRIPKSLQATNKEKSMNNLERIDIDDMSLNETSLNEASFSEMFQDKVNNPNQIKPIRKRGRPPKIKSSNQKNDFENITKGTESLKNSLEIKPLVLQETTETGIDEEKRRRLEDKICSIPNDDDVAGLELTCKNLKCSKISLDALNEVDSVNTKQETLMKTRAKYAKNNQKKQDQDNEIINNFENVVSSMGFEKASLAEKTTSVEEQIVKRRWQRGKWQTRQQSVFNSSTDVVESDLVKHQTSDKEYVEPVLQTSSADLPSPLGKTRSKRPRNSKNLKSTQETIIVLVRRKRGRKPKVVTDSNVNNEIVNSGIHIDTKLSQEDLTGSLYNKEYGFKTDEEDEISKKTDEKQICIRRGQRKNKFSVTQKDQPISVSSFYSNSITGTQNNSQMKTSTCSLEKNKWLPKNKEDEEIVTNTAVTKSNVNIYNDSSAILNFHTKPNENKTINFNDSAKDRKNVKCCKPQLKRKEINSQCHETSNETNDIDEGTTKKQKVQEDDDIEDLTTQDSHAPSNTHQSTASDTYSCMNQAFLWNKLSGFLNKTTRSVGTQVKIKNLILKGFEVSEPEVSLQNEMTLPQVIKTLFEELKTTDSSFSDL